MQDSLKEILTDRVTREFERNFVISPENPFTIDNPNLIVRQGSILYAVYIPYYNEKRNYDHLLRRLYFSQMAYGTSLVTILLLNEGDKINNYETMVIENSFNHISYGVNDLIAFIKKGSRINIHRESIFRAKKIMFTAYDINTYIIKKYYKSYADCPFDLLDNKICDISAPSLIHPTKDRKVRNVYVFENGFIYHRKKQFKSSFLNLFESIFTQVFLQNFSVENGDIIPKRSDKKLMAIVNTDWQIMDRMLNPNGYCRAFSFSGILPLSISDEDSYNQIYENYRQIQNLNKYV